MTAGLILALVLGLAACASAPPERFYYLLRAQIDGDLAPADPKRLAGIGPVRIAPYLNQAGVMVQVEENRIREARYHLWAEPLDRSIRYYLEDRVASLLGRQLNPGPGATDSWRYRIDVSVEEFHGTMNGEVRLVARWSLVDLKRDSVLETQRFARKLDQMGDGYPGLVTTQIALLDELSAKLADALRQVSA